MLFKIDTLFGHVVEDSEDGPVYKDDGSKVAGNIRPCFGCQRAIKQGEHDPCIANLPDTMHACCGHGRERTPVHNRLSGYVALRDGRRFEFPGTKSGDEIRAAVALALEGKELPEGFTYTESCWWEGLTEAQVAYVHEHMREAIFHLVREVTGGQLPSDQYLQEPDMFWADGVEDDHKHQVMAAMAGMINDLVAEALAKA